MDKNKRKHWKTKHTNNLYTKRFDPTYIFFVLAERLIYFLFLKKERITYALIHLFL